eukprot:g12202.t1
MGRDRRLYWAAVDRKFARNRKRIAVLGRVYRGSTSLGTKSSSTAVTRTSISEEEDFVLHDERFLEPVAVAFERQKKAFIARHGAVADSDDEVVGGEGDEADAQAEAGEALRAEPEGTDAPKTARTTTSPATVVVGSEKSDDALAYLSHLHKYPPGLVRGYKRESLVRIAKDELVFCGLDQLCVGSRCEYDGGNVTGDGTIWLGQNSVTFYNKTSDGTQRDQRDVGSRCEYDGGNVTGDGTIWLGQNSITFYNKTRKENASTSAGTTPARVGVRLLVQHKEFRKNDFQHGDVKTEAEELERHWRVAFKDDGCAGTIIPTRTIFLNRPMIKEGPICCRFGYGSRLNLGYDLPEPEAITE